MKISSLMGNSQRLDGGAMFGNVPKVLWSRWTSVDDRNRIPLACRCFLIEESGRRILLEAGIGAFFEPKLRDRYGVVEAEHRLLHTLAERGLTDADIDIVVLSHLHFDHAGGLLTAWKEGIAPSLLFPNATIVVGRSAWERATHPHLRDRASFLPDLNALLEASGRLEIIDDHSPTLGSTYRFHHSDGHTPGLLLTEVAMPGGPVVFAGDLVPATPWIHLPITMGYDRFPEQLIEEKQALLSDLAERGGRLLYTHDAEVAMSGVHLQGRRYQAIDPQACLDGWSA